MRKLLILLSLFCFHTAIGQTSINWASIVGNWKLDKEIQVRNEDTISVVKPDKTIIYSFESTSKFTDSSSTVNTAFIGTYTIDKKGNKISFTDITQTTKFPGSKLKNYVATSVKPEISVKKLTSDIFVYYTKGCDNAEPANCGFYTYLHKVK